MCNECVCVDACTNTPPIGNVRSTIYELCEVIKMMRGELNIGQPVTIRPRGMIYQLMEENYFYRNGEDIGVGFGEHGTIESFTAGEVGEISLLSDGIYTVLLDNGERVHVPSASGLRYDGQKIEFRLCLT